MSSLEQLKAKQRANEQEKNEKEKQDRKNTLEDNQKRYEKTKKVKESLEKRQEEIEKESEDVKRKRTAISSAFKSVIGQIKDEYEKVKEDPDSLFSHFFLKDEEGKPTKNLDKKKVIELDEIQKEIPELKSTKEKRKTLKSQKEKLSKTKDKLEDQEKELYPKTKEALNNKYIEKQSYLDDMIDDVKGGTYVYPPFKNSQKLFKEEPEQIENVKELIKEKISKEFEDNREWYNSPDARKEEKEAALKKYTDYAEELVQEYAAKQFDNHIDIRKVQQVYNKENILKTLNQNGWEGVSMDRVEYELNNLEKDFEKYKNILSELKWKEGGWDRNEVNLKQNISFSKSYGSFPIGSEAISKKESINKHLMKLSAELDKKERELEELSKKNPFFGKTAHQKKISEAKEVLENLKKDYKESSRNITKESNNYLTENKDFKVLKDINKYLEENLDKDFMAGIRANFIVKEDAGQQITLEDYINRLKKALVEAGKKLDKKKEDLKELIEVFEVYKENEEKSGLKDLEQKLKKHFSEK